MNAVRKDKYVDVILNDYYWRNNNPYFQFVLFNNLSELFLNHSIKTNHKIITKLLFCYLIYSYNS